MRDEKLFSEIVVRHKDMLFRICCAYTKDPDERKDLYQEALVHVWAGLDSFRNDAELKTWLYRIAVNTCLTWVRSEQRRRQRFTRQANAVVENIPAIANESVEWDDSLRRMYECISKLRPVDRILISLFLEEHDTRQIAAVMGISEGNVRIKLHRVKAELRQLWEEAGHGL